MRNVCNNSAVGHRALVLALACSVQSMSPMEGQVMPKTATLGLPKLPVHVLVPHFLVGGPGMAIRQFGTCFFCASMASSTSMTQHLLS